MSSCQFSRKGMDFADVYRIVFHIVGRWRKLRNLVFSLTRRASIKGPRKKTASHQLHYLPGVSGRPLIQSLMTCAVRVSTRLCENGGIFTVGTRLVMR